MSPNILPTASYVISNHADDQPIGHPITQPTRKAIIPTPDRQVVSPTHVVFLPIPMTMLRSGSSRTSETTATLSPSTALSQSQKITSSGVTSVLKSRQLNGSFNDRGDMSLSCTRMFQCIILSLITWWYCDLCLALLTLKLGAEPGLWRTGTLK